jgi:putative ABC transport system permease protein
VTPLGLAWRNLSHHRVRTLIAAVGVGFAVLLVFMQVGFYGSVKRTASMLFDHLRFDLAIVSADHQDLSRVVNFPRARIAQARAVPGVATVTPLSIGAGNWRNREVNSIPLLRGRTDEGSGSSIFMIGLPPEAVGRVFQTGPDRFVFPDRAAADRAGQSLARRDAVLLDRASRPEFGSVESHRAERLARLNGRTVEVVGEFELGTGFSWKGMLITSEETFAAASYRPATHVTLGLVEVESGADADAVKAALERSLPPDVDVFTVTGMAETEIQYWVNDNTLGELLYGGAFLAVVIGVIFLYQMMSADIRNQLGEYATAKALGYGPGYLRSVVLWQAVLLAAIGYVPGLIVARGLYEVAKAQAGLPMALEPLPALAVFGLTVGMCVGSGLLAVRKVHTADPASLF